MFKTKLIRSIVYAALVAITIFPLYTMVFEYPMFTRLLMENAADDAHRIAHHLAESAVSPDRILSKETIKKDFLADAETIKKDFGLVKLKIFAPSGLVLFSTDPKDVGVVNHETYFQERVAAGENYAKVIQKDHRTLEGQLVKRDVVEAYIPLMSGAQFRGAFEIYLDITDERQRLLVLLSRSYFLISVISLVLLGTVIVSSFRATRSIRQRELAEEEIHRINADLSTLFEISSAASKTLNLDDLLSSVLTTMTRQDILRFEHKGGIYIVEGDELVLRAHLGHSEQFIAGRSNLKIVDFACGDAVRTGEVIIVQDSSANRHGILPENDVPCGHVIIPLKGTSAVIGILYLYIPADAVVNERHKRLLGTIGNEVGMAVENARLFAKTLELSLRDPLTGLANRRLMDIMLDNSIGIAKRYGTPLSVLIADIDFFKQYNDTYGHSAGDELLARLAGILRNNMREIDLAVRYGGEEFLILLPETGCDKATEIAERVRKTIQSEAGVTISFGVTCYRPTENRDDMIARADEALYKSKQEGRNRVTLSM